MTSQRPGIYAANAWYEIQLEILIDRNVILPMAGNRTILSDHKSPDLYFFGFEVEIINTVVSDQWVGRHHYLPGK